MMASDPATTQEVASCLHILEPDSFLLEQWIGMLSSGGYKHGYGLLRSGEDEYDAFGVLAAASFSDWVWDEDECAWSLNGRVDELAPEDLARFLGIKMARPDKDAARQALERLRDAIVTTNDACSDFHGVAHLLTKAKERAVHERSRSDRMPHDLYSHRFGREDGFVGQYRG